MRPFGDHAAGDRAELRHLEDVAHFGDADPDFLERRIEQPGHRLLHLVGDVVDDRVLADVDALARRRSSSALRSGRTLNAMMIAFDADASSTSDSFTAPTPAWMIRIFTFSSVSFASVSASTSAEPCTSALMMIGSSFMPPSAICACSDSSVSRPPFAPSARFFACSSRNVAICRALAASATWNTSPGCGSPVEAEHFDRRRRSGRLGRPAAVVDQRAHAADDRAGDERVADAERAVLHEHGRDRTAALVELRFEHRARRAALRVRLELADVADEQDHLEQQIDVLLLLAPTLRR